MTTSDDYLVVPGFTVAVELDLQPTVNAEIDLYLPGAGADGDPGPVGPTGPPGPAAVSADAGNVAELGSDGLVLVQTAIANAVGVARVVSVDLPAVAAQSTTEIVHNLGTRDVLLQCYRLTDPWDTLVIETERVDLNRVLLRVWGALGAGEVRVVITG